MRPFRGIKALIFSVIAGYHFDRGDRVKARNWMDRTFAIDLAHDSSVIGTDAILYVLEGRSSKAAARFNDCLAAIEQRPSANDEYLRIFCSFWLKILFDQASAAELEDMTIRAFGLKVDAWFQRRFRFPPREAIQKTLGQTKSYTMQLAIDF